MSNPYFWSSFEWEDLNVPIMLCILINATLNMYRKFAKKIISKKINYVKLIIT